MKFAKRYGPFVAVAVIVVIAIAVFGGGGDGDKDDTSSNAALDRIDTDELIRNGPMTPEKAELTDATGVDFGPNCDTERGRIKIPTPDAAPCVEPFTGDNGGATSTGVTDDEVLVVAYQANPNADALGAAALGDVGVDVMPEGARLAFDRYTALYNSIFETYGRTVRLEYFVATGASDDQAAARADAIAIADKEPFAVIGGPIEALPTFATELAAHDIVCGPGCADGLPESMIEENAPYLWPVGATPNQVATLVAEAIGKLAGPGKAAFAGDAALQDKERVYGSVHYENGDGDFRQGYDVFTAALADYDIELAVDHEIKLELAEAQEDARTIIAKMEDAGVTTVIYQGDPFTQASLTREATAQDYWPEWILGSSVLADTTIFGRQADGEQWKNGFGISSLTARGGPETYDSQHIYRWAFDEAPPDRQVIISEPGLRFVFSAIHLAGENLTPETFRDGVFRHPPVDLGPTVAYTSRGDYGVWPDVDYGGVDDVTLIWWDPEATGEDELGLEGTGMYRYAKGGQRYGPGELPDSPEDAGLFDDADSVVIYDQLPPEDQPPDYPRPEV